MWYWSHRGQIFRFRIRSMFVMYSSHRSQRVHSPAGISFFLVETPSVVSFCFLNHATMTVPPGAPMPLSQAPEGSRFRSPSPFAGEGQSGGQAYSAKRFYLIPLPHCPPPARGVSANFRIDNHVLPYERPSQFSPRRSGGVRGGLISLDLHNPLLTSPRLWGRN